MMLRRVSLYVKRRLKKIRTRRVITLHIGESQYEVREYCSLWFRRPLIRYVFHSSPDGDRHISAIDLSDPTNMPVMSYAKPFCDKWLQAKESRALVLGVGGGGIPRYMAVNFDRCRITGVEIEPDFIALARQYFLSDLSESRRKQLEIVVDDARHFIAHDDRKFDLIISDICNSQRACHEIYDDVFIRDLHQRLATGGVIVFNMYSTPARPCATVLQNLRREFDWVELLVSRNSTEPVIIAGGAQAYKSVKELLEHISTRRGIVRWMTEFTDIQ